MNKKAPAVGNVDELLYAIRSSMKAQSGHVPGGGASMDSPLPGLVRFRHSYDGRAPDSLAVTQFYLKQYGAPDAATLEVLPTDMFVLC